MTMSDRSEDQNENVTEMMEWEWNGDDICLRLISHLCSENVYLDAFRSDPIR